MATDTDTQNKRRLNPFIFPSETNARFTLLVMAALMLAFSEGLNLSFEFNIADATSFPSIDIPLNDTKAVEQGLIEWNNAWVQSLSLAAFPFGLMASVLFLAMAIYRGHADRIRRNQNLRVMTRDNDPRFVDAVQELVALSEISPAPSIEVASESGKIYGQAFGLRNHYALRLGGRLRLLFRKNPAQFRAIILHELAHFANADITRTYFAQAIWIATLILVVIPSIALIFFMLIKGLVVTGTPKTNDWWQFLFTITIPTILILLFQFGGTLAIVAAIRSSLLRTREIYADWRAALWGAKAPLTDILRRNAREDKARSWSLWRLHPTFQERLEALENPIHLFRVTTALPFFVGALLGYLLAGAIHFAGSIVAVLIVGPTMIGILQLSKFTDNPMILGTTVSLVIYTMIAILIATVLILGFWLVYLLAGTLGVEVQREAIADLVNNRRGWPPYLRLSKPAVLVAVGFMVGNLLTPKSILVLVPNLINFDGLVGLLMLLILTTTITFMTWLWLIYARYFGRQVFGSYNSTSSPQRVRRLLTLVLTGLLLVLYVPVAVGVAVLEVAFLGDITFQDPFVTSFLTSNIMILLLYVVIFGVTWLCVKVYKLIWKPRCPSCKIIIHQRYTVGQLCEQCGQDLASWLFVA